jgi:hypothetical protein
VSMGVSSIALSRRTSTSACVATEGRAALREGAARKRAVWVESLFGEAKEWHGG